MLDLKRQYESIKGDVEAAVERVLSSQHCIGGPELDAFEHEAAEYLGVKACVGCASGTDALWLAMAASGVEAGTSVITTPFSFFASVSAIVRCGATPVLADVDPATLNIDPLKVETALKRGRGQNIRAVLPVHLYGQCADMDSLDRLAQEYDVAIVEDAAQAFGAAWKGKKAGGLGKAAAFQLLSHEELERCRRWRLRHHQQRDRCRPRPPLAQSWESCALLPRRDWLEQPPRFDTGRGVARKAEAS